MATNGSQAYSSEERFAVSSEGMRKINESREPTDLIKELIQNAWDETIFTGECRVQVETHDPNTVITVEDDGRGFANIADAYTLMSHTDKRFNAELRGRFNIGEKDVISVALEATVETVGHTVNFPPDGSREIATNDREKGTKITVVMPWNRQQADELIRNLQTFRPPANCATYVNGTVIPRRPAAATLRASLPTVMQDNRNGAMKVYPRSTTMDLVDPAEADNERRIYEMGIPADSIECPWDVDIMQKIPMDQQRNAVKESYLRTVYIEILNSTYGKLDEKEFASTWVRKAVESGKASLEAVKATAEARWGNNVVFLSMNQDANARAHNADYEVVNPQSLSQKEVAEFRKHAGIDDADVVFPDPPEPHTDHAAKKGSNQEKFAEWVQQVASYCELDATVRYFNEAGNPKVADCTVASKIPTIRFNEGKLPVEFFEPPHNGAEQYEIVIHELGHALDYSEGPEHGPKWSEAAIKASAMVLRGMASTPTP